MVWGAFVLLCVLSSAEWVIPPAMGEIPGVELQGLMHALVGIAAAVFAVLRWRKHRPRLRLVSIALGGVAFFGLPVILLESVSGRIPSTSISALFSMAPVVVVLASERLGVTGQSGGQMLLAPALAGVGGLLCVLPFGFPDSPRGWGGFCVVVVAVVIVGVAGVWLYRLLRDVGLIEAVAAVGIANAALLLLWCGLHGELLWRPDALVQGVSILFFVQTAEIVLTIWLLRTMEAIPLSARYLVIPLLTIVEGFVAMRPEVTARLTVGVVLLGVGAWRILASRTQDEDRSLSLK